MARRVSRTGVDNAQNIFANLALLGNLDREQQAQEAPLELYGASQEPVDFNDVVETPQYTDVRQNENDYLENLRKISNLPLAMSEDENLRHDAQENMRDFEPEPPFGIQEEQLEGLSGLMGEREAENKMIPKPNLPEIATEPPEIYGIPEDNQGNMMEPLEVIRMMVQKDPSLIEMLPPETRDLLNPPVQENQIPNAPAQKPVPEIPVVPVGSPITEEMIDQYPNQNVQQGAVEKGFEDDQIVSDLINLAGGLIPEDQKKRAEDWQNVYTKRWDELTAEEQSLSQKAQSGELTTFDKIALGIAIAVPILMALRYGAEAGLSSAGGALSGFAKAQMEQDKLKGERDIQRGKRLEEIGKEKVSLQEKDVDIKKKIMDSIEDGEARRFIRNKDLRRFGDDIGISTGDESKALWLDGKKFDASDEGIKRAREVVKDADETIGIMKDSNKTLNEVIEILDQLPRDTGVWDSIKKNYQWFTSTGGKNPFGGSAPKIKVTDENGKTREVDGFALLKQKINILQDLYNKQILGGTRLTGNVVTHWGGILGDPASIENWFSQDLNSFKDTTRSLKDTMNSREIEKLVGRGFLRKPLETVFPYGNDQVVESDENRLDRLRQTDINDLRKKVK